MRGGTQPQTRQQIRLIASGIAGVFLVGVVIGFVVVGSGGPDQASLTRAAPGPVSTASTSSTTTTVATTTTSTPEVPVETTATAPVASSTTAAPRSSASTPTGSGGSGAGTSSKGSGPPGPLPPVTVAPYIAPTLASAEVVSCTRVEALKWKAVFRVRLDGGQSWKFTDTSGNVAMITEEIGYILPAEGGEPPATMRIVLARVQIWKNWGAADLQLIQFPIEPRIEVTC